MKQLKVDFNYKDINFKNIPIITYDNGRSYYSRIGAVSKVVRQYIKAKYPNAEFQIKSESFSMGNSVTVWINPHKVSKEDYKQISDDLETTFQSGNFNPMEDIYEYHNETTIQYITNYGVVNFDTKYMMVNYGYKWGSKQYKQYVEGE